MMPAVKAPSSMSRSRTMLSATSAARMTKTTRIANCPEVCSVELTNACIAPRGTRNASQIASAANPAKTASTTVDRPGSRPPRKIEIAMSGPNSPTAPMAATALPNGVGSSPASRRIGRRVPSAVEHSATPITIAASPDASRKPAAIPAARLMSHPSAARRPRRPRNEPNSISVPATKKSIASPNSDSASTNSLGTAQPSTAGPTRMPSTSSNTTTGTRIHRPIPRVSSGASTARIGITSSVGSRSSTRTD